MTASKNTMISLAISVCFIITNGRQATGQKIKYKLTFKDSAYLGTMTPKWYELVRIIPLEKDRKRLEGASGVMSGKRFGIAEFGIEKNALGTSEKLMIKTSNGWYPISGPEFRKNKLKLSYDWGFRATAQPVDLEVLKAAKKLLSSENAWNKQDDRRCDDDFKTKKWSLYCVLAQAYINETGDFNHRAAALNQVRQTIIRLKPKDYGHRLMEFNNEQDFSMIRELIDISLAEMEKQLLHKSKKDE